MNKHLPPCILAAAFAMAAIGSAAVAQENAAAFERPRYQTLRQNEDWSALADHDTSQTGDFFDPVKHIALSEDGDIWISFGGQVRTRFEVWENFGFVPANDDEFLLTRFLVHGDLHIGDHVRVFVEGKSAFSTERTLPGGRRTLDADELDLLQGFVDVILPLTLGGEDATLTIRSGRQSLLFGNQRLVSPLPWGNTIRAWDGVSVILSAYGWKVTGFWTQFVPVKKFSFNDADAQTEFFGIYATGAAPVIENASLELYCLGLERDAAAIPGGGFNGTFGGEERYTFGGRIRGPVGDTPFDYEVEGAYQTGEVGTGDIDAFMFASQVGYKLADFFGAPRVFVGFDYASGDESAGGDVETFNQLFPLGHKYLGYIDVIGRQNIIDLSTGVVLKPIDRLTTKVIGHYFWVADDSDALYNAGAGVVRAGGIATSNEVGAEIDVVFTYQINQHLKGEAGYSHFFADDWVEQTGPGSDIDFFYLQFLFMF